MGDRSPSFHISCKASTRQGRSVLGRSRMTPPVRPRRPAPDQPAAGIFREHLHRRTTAAGTSAVRGGRHRIHLPLGPLTSLSVLSDNGSSGGGGDLCPSQRTPASSAAVTSQPDRPFSVTVRRSYAKPSARKLTSRTNHRPAAPSQCPAPPRQHHLPGGLHHQLHWTATETADIARPTNQCRVISLHTIECSTVPSASRNCKIKNSWQSSYHGETPKVINKKVNRKET